MRSGDVVFLRPGDAHTLVRNTPTLELYSISATVQEVLPLLEAYQINERICSCGDPPFFSLAQQKYAISSMFENLPQSSPTQHCEQLRIILGTTIHAFLLPHSQIPNNSLSILFKQMNQADALAEGVPAMLRLCHLSHAQLCRVVKKQTGKTPQQYVRELRLLRAYDLIQSTNMAFEDIANAVGYCSLSHFATTFKGRFGVTLSELRKQKRMIL